MVRLGFSNLDLKDSKSFEKVFQKVFEIGQFMFNRHVVPS
jgi:hypothetical protein